MRLKVRAWPVKPFYPALSGIPIASVLEAEVCQSEWPGKRGEFRISVRVKDMWVHLDKAEETLNPKKVREFLIELFTVNGYTISQ